MAYDKTLAARIREAFSARPDITERKMFGGVAFLCNGRMCCGVAGPDLVVRVVENKMASALGRPHVRPMDLTGRPLRGFVFVSPGGCRTNASLRAWLAEGLRFLEENYPTRPTRARLSSRVSPAGGKAR